MPRHVLILAAGLGSRMRSRRPKVLHNLAGLTLIEHVLRSADALAPKTTGVVIGHLADQLKVGLAQRSAISFAYQQEQQGTGHAVLQAEPLFRGQTGTLVVLSGDVPLIRSETLERLLTTHEKRSAAFTVLTATVNRPYGYGRIIRRNGRISRIVEEREATEPQRKLKEVNGGIYALDLSTLFGALKEVPPGGTRSEIYLPGLVSIYRRRGLSVDTLNVANPEEVRGINSQSELAEVKRIVKQTKNEELMAAGVTIEDPATTYIDMDVTVGADTIIHPGVALEGQTKIGARCELHTGARVVNSYLADDVVVNNHCVIREATLERGARVGPFAHLRPEAHIGEAAQVGNFVEIKKSSIGSGSKANHLTYLGDATIGNDVNIGAGTITCNYDQGEKHPTSIGNRVFIGSGTELIAPVSLGDDAYVAAGSCISDDVPSGALGVARSRQVNKDGWVTRRKPKSADS